MKQLRTLVFPVVISALAIAGFSSGPARAGDGDLAKLLIGLGAVAVTIKALEKNKGEAAVSRNDRIVRLPQSERPKPRLSYAIPANCLKTYVSDRGDRQLYSGRCLSNVSYKLAELPETCSYTIMGRHKALGKAYGPRCMARHGFHQVRRSAKATKPTGRHIVYGY